MMHTSENIFYSTPSDRMGIRGQEIPRQAEKEARTATAQASLPVPPSRHTGVAPRALKHHAASIPSECIRTRSP